MPCEGLCLRPASHKSTTEESVGRDDPLKYILELTGSGFNTSDFRSSEGAYADHKRTDRIIQYLQDAKVNFRDKKVWVPGAGTGMLVIYAAAKGAYVTASEIKPKVCQDMIANIKQAGLEDRVTIKEGNFLNHISHLEEFDFILAHPPIFGMHGREAQLNVQDPYFSFILGLIRKAIQRLKAGGRLIMLYTSTYAAKNLQRPEEDIYLFDLENKRKSLEGRGFKLFYVCGDDREAEATIWEIVKPARMAGPGAVSSQNNPAHITMLLGAAA